ncbi:hypothetical protein ACIREE_26780 [Streptomyces sp. NPDC102467]|uniref:hypothetical protein n=1 Tax=Streptomyces sp. NPDC102467 TaxID=3366179 RepID=UPI0037FBD8A8
MEIVAHLTGELGHPLGERSAVWIAPGAVHRWVFALRSAASGLQGLVAYGRDLLRTGVYLDDWERFVTEAAGQHLARGDHAPGRPRHIALRDVTFRYPGTAEAMPLSPTA